MVGNHTCIHGMGTVQAHNQLLVRRQTMVSVPLIGLGSSSTSNIVCTCRPDRTRSTHDYMKEHGFHEEVLDGLLNLDLALQCDGFVSSFASNWARLIEELRSTVRCKANSAYIDVDPRFALTSKPLQGVWPYNQSIFW